MRALLPGKCFLAWYRDDQVWHEHQALYPVDSRRWIIHTADGDVYAEDLSCTGGDGPFRLQEVDDDGIVAADVTRPVYRFRYYPNQDELKDLIRDPRIEAGRATPDGQAVAVAPPDLILHPEGHRVAWVEWFGTGRRIGHKRAILPLRTAPARPPPPGPVDGAVAGSSRPRPLVLPADDAPDGFVWLSAEPLGGTSLGQEMFLNMDTDVCLGAETAMAQRLGSWVRCDLVAVTDAAGYAEKRSSLFRPALGEGPPRADLRERLKGPAERLDVTGLDSSPKATETADVRTLWVDYDDQGERYKRWRNVVQES